jgi:hypothetical protein
MADLVITPANVIAGAGATLQSSYAGVAIAAGQVIYINPADSKAYLAVANGTAQQATVAGIALNGAAVGQPVWYITAGPLNVGTVLSQGKLYVLSGAVAGNIAPTGDLAAGWRTSLLGYAVVTSQLQVGLVVTGITN